jgi:hypothetical protein
MRRQGDSLRSSGKNWRLRAPKAARPQRPRPQIATPGPTNLHIPCLSSRSPTKSAHFASNAGPTEGHELALRFLSVQAGGATEKGLGCRPFHACARHDSNVRPLPPQGTPPVLSEVAGMPVKADEQSSHTLERAVTPTEGSSAPFGA